MRAEFDRQVENLIAKGYPALAGMRADRFRQELIPLASAGDGGPFAIVIRSGLVATADAMARVELDGTQGFVDMTPAEPGEFAPIDGIELPAGTVYLLTGVDAGEDLRNVTPDEALKRIVAQGRSPLTIDEGVAVVTHDPEILRARTCFSLLGSRRGDKRVPALWISRKSPRLGWCWAGNPHTWLGSASCSGRMGA